MVGSLVSDSALTVAPLEERNGSSTWAELYPSQHRMFSSLERSAMALRRPSVPPAAKAEAHSADCCMKFRRDSFDVNIVPLPVGRVTAPDVDRHAVPDMPHCFCVPISAHRLLAGKRNRWFHPF